MAKTKTTPTPDSDLGEFDGFAIDGMLYKIAKAGDSLSKAITADGEARKLRKDDRVSIVLEAVVGTVAFPPVKGHDDRVSRHHELICETITFVDRGLVADILDDQRSRNEEAAEEERLRKTGQPRLDDAGPVTEGDDTLDPELEDGKASE